MQLRFTKQIIITAVNLHIPQVLKAIVNYYLTYCSSCDTHFIDFNEITIYTSERYATFNVYRNDCVNGKLLKTII